MYQDNFLALKAISDKYTEKFLAKIPRFPAEVLTIQLVIPPTAKRFVSFNYKGAQAILDHLFEKTNLNFEGENKGAFLIEFEKHEFYTELSMEIRLILTGEISNKTIKLLKKNIENKPLSLLGISADFVELSDVSMLQLDELVHPYLPELGGQYEMEHLKIMSRVYNLGHQKVTLNYGTGHKHKDEIFIFHRFQNFNFIHSSPDDFCKICYYYTF
jgi:hypothetical protein